MSDNFEFDDDDDALLNSIFTPKSESTTPIKCGNNSTTIDISSNKRKFDDCNDSLSPLLSPVIGSPLNNSKEFWKNDLSKNNIPNAVKRIFPGPAGILSDENDTITSNQMDVCSQNTSSIFQEGPWKEMSKDFKISSSIHLHDKFNIAWIKKEATANQYTIQKAPFLAATLLSLEVSDGQSQKSVNVTIKDMTGTIQGNILYNLYEEYASHLTLGSVLILVQFGVLSCTCDKCDNHHLTITPNNLSAIYNGKEKIVIKKVDPQEVLADFCQQKKELALSIRNKAQVKHNTPSRSSVIANRRPCLTMNTKTGFNNACSSKNVSSNNMSTNFSHSFDSPLKKASQESFPLPKVKSICGDTVQSRLQAPTVNTSLNSSSKLFTFKKVSKVTDSCPLPSSINRPSANLQNMVEDCSNSNKSSDCREPMTTFEDSVENRLNPNIEIEANTRMSNSFDNSTPSQVSCSDTKQLGVSKDPGRCIKISGNQMSVKVDRQEDEKLWKDVLDNVDLSSLFDDDF